MEPTIEEAATSGAGAGDDAGSGKETDAAAGRTVELPLHVTEKILCCISPLASARLATVCKSWAATVAARLARPVPHLFVCMPPDNISDHRGVIVYVPLDGEALGGGARLPSSAIPARVRTADTNGLRCVGATPSGRLAFANWWSRDVVLVNPVTGALQRLDMGRMPGRGVVPAAGGGVDSFLSVDDDGLGLRWYARGSGEEWSNILAAAAAAHRADDVLSAANCDGRLYALHADGSVSTVDAAAPPPLRAEKLPVASLIDELVAPPRVLALNDYLLESEGEVLFVRQLVASREVAVAFCGHREFLAVVGFEVYRLDVENRRWTSVAALDGDRALFVSAGSSFSVRVADAAGCRSNCIYFVGLRRYCSECNISGGSTWGVYSLQDREVLFEHAVTGPGINTAALWFLPNTVV